MERYLSDLGELINHPPSFKRIKYSNGTQTNPTEILELKQLLSTETARSFPPSAQFLRKEQYILRKLNYKMTGCYRKHNCFQAVKRIRTSLEKFCDIHLSAHLSEFSSGPEVASSHREASVYFPSRERFDLLLALITKAALLLAEILRFCRICACYSGQQLNVEHFVQPNIVILGTVSTVWRHCGEMLNRFVQLYSRIRPWRAKIISAASIDPDIEFLSDLKDIPTVTDAVVTGATVSNPTQKTVYSEFFKNLLGTDSEEFKLAVNSGAVNSISEQFMSTDDSSGQKQTSTRKSEMRSLLHSTSNLKGLKKFYKALKKRLESGNKSERKKCKRAVSVLKRRWSSLIQLKRLNDSERLAAELEIVKVELSKLV